MHIEKSYWNIVFSLGCLSSWPHHSLIVCVAFNISAVQLVPATVSSESFTTWKNSTNHEGLLNLVSIFFA